jgi:hypothetical protein
MGRWRPDRAVSSLAIGAVLSGLAVGAGAFGAHSLRDVIDPEALQLWKTAVDLPNASCAWTTLAPGLSAVVIPERRHLSDQANSRCPDHRTDTLLRKAFTRWATVHQGSSATLTPSSGGKLDAPRRVGSRWVGDAPRRVDFDGADRDLRGSQTKLTKVAPDERSESPGFGGGSNS